MIFFQHNPVARPPSSFCVTRGENLWNDVGGKNKVFLVLVAEEELAWLRDISVAYLVRLTLTWSQILLSFASDSV